MASLESHLSALLAAFHDSHKDIPNVDPSRQIEATAGSFTAPADGIVSVGENGNSGIFTVLQNEVQVFVSDDATVWTRIWVFVRKGDEVRCNIGGGAAQSCLFYFVPLS